VSTLQRGYCRPGDLVAVSDYPLGLFEARARFTHPAVVLVFPKPLAGPMEARRVASGAGDAVHQEVRGVDDFEGLKPYQPGDSIQRISWKAFSRGQGMLTKQFLGGSGDAVLFDWQAISGGDVETRLSRLCDMVIQAHRRRMTYGLRLPQRTVAPGRSAAHHRECLQSLALFETGPYPP
jgi:uncharacterized protein (DUF58 family)